MRGMDANDMRSHSLPALGPRRPISFSDQDLLKNSSVSFTAINVVSDSSGPDLQDFDSRTALPDLQMNAWQKVTAIPE